jgi:threonine dehydrogenase-like Zn-dependent dehydrogenase
MVVTDECGSGHESAGEIVEVGEGVTQWKRGDRVAIEAGVPCSNCDACRTGRYNACECRASYAGLALMGLKARTLSSSVHHRIMEP